MPITRRDYFKPIQLDGCVLWLDGTDPAGTGTAPANGSTLTSWVDKSGAGRNLIVGSGTTTYTNSAITLASSYMYVTSAVDLTNFSFFIIAKTNAAINNQTVFGARPNTVSVFTSSDGFGFYMDNQTSIRFFGNNTAGQLINQSIATSNPNMFSFTSGSTVINGRFNGNPVPGATGLTTRTSTAQGFAIGAEWSGSAYGNTVSTASIYEIIVYNQGLSTTQGQQVEAYLAQKWSLTGSLPAGHPGLTSVLYRGVVNKLTISPYYTQFSPKSIPGASLWLDGADPAGTGVVPANGATVSTWTDKSGSGYNATGGVSPTYNTSQRAIVFNGSSWLSTSYSSVPANETAFIVYQTTSTAIANNCFMIGPTNTGGRLILSVNENDGFGLSFKIGSYGIANGSRIVQNQNQMYLGTTTVASTTSFVYLNGTQGPSSTLTYSGSGTTQIGTAVSGTAIYIGFIYEIVIFNRLLSNPERQTVESYLAQKWGLTAALPASHINNTFPAGSPVALQTYISRIKTNIAYNLYLPGIPSINTPTNTGNITTLTMTWTAPAVTGTAGTVSGYIVYIAASGSLVATQTLGNVLTTTFSPMTTNLNYSYSVAATGPGGTGVASPSSLTTVYYATPDAPTVNTPTNTTDTLNMSWNAPAGTVTSYTVYVRAGSSVVATLTPGLVTSTTYSPMTQSVAYSFYVTATNGTVTSGNSTTSATVTYTPAVVLPSEPYWLAGGTATGNNAVLAYSGNRGINWTNIPLGFSGTVYCVAYNGSNLFVMGGTFASCLYTSSNGIDWTANGQTLLTGVFSVVYAANISTWVAVGNGPANSIIYSTNGTTWNGAGSIMTTQVLGVAYNGTNLFVAIGYGGSFRLATSVNGISWTGRTTSAFPTYGYGISYSSNGIWLATGTGNPNVAYSTDGTTWSSTVHIASMTNGYGTAFLSNTYLVCGTAGGVFTSANLTSWTQTVPGITAFAISANSNTAICASAGSSTTFSRSENGTTWSSVPLSSASMFTNSVQGLCHVP